MNTLAAFGLAVLDDILSGLFLAAVTLLIAKGIIMVRRQFWKRRRQ